MMSRACDLVGSTECERRGAVESDITYYADQSVLCEHNENSDDI